MQGKTQPMSYSCHGTVENEQANLAASSCGGAPLECTLSRFRFTGCKYHGKCGRTAPCTLHHTEQMEPV